MVINHRGGLCLHGSAVATPLGAAAFLGVSRSGKTTLAGAMARAGHPFLTEDAIELVERGGRYAVQPKDPVLRLFADSIEYLGADVGSHKSKVGIAATSEMPAFDSECPLRAIYLLGESDAVRVDELMPAAALSELLRHAFVLDVEDRQRLAAHFARIADLVDAVPCRRLSYPRRFGALPTVIDAVVDDLSILSE